jgi:hypothetical protein
MPIKSPEDRQVDNALLYARNKLRLRLGIIIGLVVLSAWSIIFTANGYFVYLSRYSELSRSMKDLWTDQYHWVDVHAQNAPQDIVLDRVYLFPRGNNTYDLAVEAYNPNQQWAIANVKYQFLSDGQTVAAGESSLLPGEKRLLTVYGQKSDSLLQVPNTVNVFDYQWRKVTANLTDAWQYPQPAQFQARRVVDSSGAPSVVPARVVWSATNNTGANLAVVRWQVILRSGGTVVYVGDYQAEKLAYRETRSYSLAVSDTISRVDTVEVHPVYDMFDSANTFVPTSGTDGGGADAGSVRP